MRKIYRGILQNYGKIIEGFPFEDCNAEEIVSFHSRFQAGYTKLDGPLSFLCYHAECTDNINVVTLYVRLR